MELVQLCMKKRGIRFFAKIPKEIENKINACKCKCYRTKEAFLTELERREDEYDMILIAAHGAEHKIIVPLTQRELYRQECLHGASSGFKSYISIEETKFFKNDFVFAVSCLTAKDFGPAVVKNGVLAYLGYDTIIEGLFDVSDVNMSSRVRELYAVVAKKIFIKELANAVSRFLNDMQNVKVLKQWFALHLEKSLVEFFSMSAEEVYATYNIGISKDIWNKNRQKLQIQQLNFLGEINKHFIILGDPEYISLYGIENGCCIDKQMYDRLREVSFMNKDYEKKFRNELQRLIEVQDENGIY